MRHTAHLGISHDLPDKYPLQLSADLVPGKHGHAKNLS